MGKKLGKKHLVKIARGENKYAEQLLYEILAYLLVQRKEVSISEVEIEDIAQTALFMLIYKEQNVGIELTSALNTYAIAIAKKLMLKYLRDRKQMISLNSPDVLLKLIEEEPENHQLKEDKWVLYHESFKKLSAECQKLFRLSYKRVNQEKISQKMGYASAKYVKIKKSRCKEKLITFIENDPTYKQIEEDD